MRKVYHMSNSPFSKGRIGHWILEICHCPVILSPMSPISLVGVFLVYIQEHRLKKLVFILVSFAVGTLLGDVFFHLLPELFQDASNPLVISAFVLGGIFIFF